MIQTPQYLLTGEGKVKLIDRLFIPSKYRRYTFHTYEAYSVYVPG